MNRREFLWVATGAAVLGGCRTAGVRDNAALRAAVDGYVADGLYLGLACASNRGDLYVKGRRTLGEPRLPVTADTLFDLASVGKTHTAARNAALSRTDAVRQPPSTAAPDAPAAIHRNSRLFMGCLQLTL